MLLRGYLVACLLVYLGTVHHSHAQSGPTIMSQSTTVLVSQGKSVILECKVSNLGTNKISWTFITTQTTIYQGGLLMTDNPTKYSIIRPIDSSAYNLQILLVAKSDQGFYKCAIDGTDQSITVHLDVLEKINRPQLPNLSDLDRTECCEARNVSQDCVAACSNLDFAQNCVNDNEDLASLMYCLSAGSNHEHCCLLRDVDPVCLPFCRSEIPSDLGSKHNICLLPTTFSIFKDCATENFALLPSEPEDLSVIPHNRGTASSILVSWKPPARNADKVTGYKIMYKRSGSQKYFSVIKRDPLAHFVRLSNSHIVPNQGYDVHMAALAEHGVSGATVEVSVFIPDSSLNDLQNKDVDECCTDRQVSDACRTGLCHSKTWSQLNIDFLSQCFSKLGDIFTCLAGEQDHSNCCSAFGVTSECIPLCSGAPPALNSSLIACVQQMAIVEACVQQGYETLPVPPSKLVLKSVKSHEASLTFEPSPSIGVVRYVVLLKKGETPDATFKPWGYLNSDDKAFILEPLLADTVYAVRLTSETAQYGSLPSETVHFLTYPENFGIPTIPPVINVPHNFTECCYSKGMPDICAEGCKYVQTISSHYQEHLQECYSHIGTVLSCAADGRDHETCCIGRNVTDPDCLDLCGLAADGPLDERYVKCLKDTPKAIACFQSGVDDLPRYPDAFVRNVSENSIGLEWIHPPTSTLIDMYIVQYKASSDGNFKQEMTNETHLILHNLLSATEYQITIRSRNVNGTSSPSPLIRQYTLEGMSKKPDFEKTEVTGRQYWQNITDCCHSSGISDGCIDQCLNKQAGSTNCGLESHKMLACYLAGQDHGECCRENPDLPSTCVAICRGIALNLTVDVMVCMGYGYRDIILSCYLRNSDLIPSAPLSMFVRLKDSSNVEVVWKRPGAYCGVDCSFDVHYWLEYSDDPGARKVIVKSGVSSPYTVKISPDGGEGFYTFAVVARNSYGSSPSSSLQTLYVSSYSRDVKVTLQSNKYYVDKGSTAVLQCGTIDFNPLDPITISWMYNGRRKLSSTMQTLVVTNVDPVKDEGTYSCHVKDSVMEVTDSLFLLVRYAPQYIDNRDKSVLPGQGTSATIACVFRGLPDIESDKYNWMKDNKALRMENSKYFTRVYVDFRKGFTDYLLLVYDVDTNDYGDYALSVSNKFGSSSCRVAIRNPDELTTIIPAKKVADPKACCASEGISELCQELCSFSIDVAEVIAEPKYITCLTHFTSLIKCSADGKDHRGCCKDKGVKPYCFPFCAGQSPGSHVTDQTSLVDCVSESQAIFSCIEEGQTLSPYSPTNVMLRRTPAGIQVRWSRPQYNHHLIKSYVVYYKSSSDPTERNHGVNELIQEYTIPNPDDNARYEVYVVSANGKHLSQKSNVATLEPLTLLPPTNLQVQVSRVTAIFTWTLPADADTTVQYIVHYKETNAVRYEKTRNIQGTSFTLTNLEENTPYTAYIISISLQSAQSTPSEHITFTTGKRSSTTDEPGTKEKQGGGGDNNDEIAIGVGVVVAVIALIIIGAVVFIIIKGRGGFKSTGDTVAFENPVAGGSGGVKIHGMGGNDDFNYGRLEEDNAYDNTTSMTVPASTDGAYVNPTYAGQESAGASEGAATLELNSEA